MISSLSDVPLDVHAPQHTHNMSMHLRYLKATATPNPFFKKSQEYASSGNLSPELKSLMTGMMQIVRYYGYILDLLTISSNLRIGCHYLISFPIHFSHPT